MVRVPWDSPRSAQPLRQVTVVLMATSWRVAHCGRFESSTRRPGARSAERIPHAIRTRDDVKPSRRGFAPATHALCAVSEKTCGRRSHRCWTYTLGVKDHDPGNTYGPDTQA